jgi:hypothetical protein
MTLLQLLHFTSECIHISVQMANSATDFLARFLSGEFQKSAPEVFTSYRKLLRYSSYAINKHRYIKDKIYVSKKDIFCAIILF